MELEKIGIGAYKPLKGFMTKEDFYSVVNKNPDKSFFNYKQNTIVYPIDLIF